MRYVLKRPRILMLLVFCCLWSLSCGKPQASVSLTPEKALRPVSDWQRIGPGGGGSTFWPAFCPGDPDKILIRCDMTGTYLTHDGGQWWEMIDFPGGSHTFAFDPSNPQVMYVGAKGLYRSSDDGRTWNMLFPHPDSLVEVRYGSDHADSWFVTKDNFPKETGTSVAAVCVDPDNSERIFLGMNRATAEGLSGLFCSQDNGLSWVSKATLDGAILTIWTAPVSGDDIFVFTSRAMYKYNKRTGEIVEKKLPPHMESLISVSCGIDADAGNMRFYALAPTSWEESRPVGGVFVSEDAGESWKQVTQALTEGLVKAGGRSLSFSYIACAAEESRTAYLVCDQFLQKNKLGNLGHWYGIFKTDDGGESWQWVYKGGGGSSDYTIRDGWEAENANDSWVREAFSGEYIRVITVGVYPGNGDLAIFTDWYRAMKTSDGGESWNEVYSERQPDGSVRSRGMDVTTSYGVHFDPFNQDHIFISYTDMAGFHSFNGGKSWFRSAQGVPSAWDNTCYWLQFDPEEKDKLWSVWSSWHDIPRLKMIRTRNWENRAVGGVCVSTDGGRNWSVSSQGLPENSPTTCIVLDPGSPGGSRTLYITVYGKGVYKSVDDGKTWVNKNTGLGTNLNAWELHLAEDGKLYLVVTQNVVFHEQGSLPELVDGELFVSADKAETWTRVSMPAGAKFPNSLTSDPRKPERLYLSCWGEISTGDFRGYYGQPEADGSFRDRPIETEGGVFLSEDGGLSWKSVFDRKAYVYALTVDPNNPGRLYINTFQGEAFRSDDYGQTWKRLKGYDFKWGHRVIIDKYHPEMLYLTTFGGSVFYGPAAAEN